MENSCKTLEKIIEAYHLKQGMEINFASIEKIAQENKIIIKDVISMLGMSKISFNRVKKNPKYHARIRIFTIEEMQEIETKLIFLYDYQKRVSLAELEKISESFCLDNREIRRILKICRNTYNRSKKLQTYVRINVQEQILLNKIMLEEVKYKEYITMSDIQYLAQKYQKTEAKVREELNLKVENFWELKKGRTQKMSIQLLQDAEIKEIEDQIIEICKESDFITKEKIKKIKEQTKANDAIIKKILSISSKKYNALLKGDTHKSRIVLRETKVKTKKLTIDLKYKYGQRYYKTKELEKICTEYGLPMDDYLKNMHIKIEHYFFNKLALQRNNSGLYIGEEHSLSHDFACQNQNKIEKICANIANKYCYLYRCRGEREDYQQEAITLILQKGGIIEKNFQFDESLLFGLLGKKAKCMILARCIQKYKKELKEKRFSEEHFYQKRQPHSSQKLMNWGATQKVLKEIESCRDKEILVVLMENIDLFLKNRDYVLRRISDRWKISVEVAEKRINEIGKSMIKNKMVRICENGKIINMAEIE